ncbi:MAG TPA: ABC transporter ATP-binding protein [Stellaceae bacterium]
MLSADNLAFGYRGKPVGSGVSIDIRAGEVLCLLGPNGGGKTTLMKTLLGLLPPLAGAVRLDGVDVAAWPRKRLARVVGYVPQAHAAFFPFAVSDIVLMGRSAHVGLFAAPSRHDRAVAARALETLGIGHLHDRIYTEISGGERQLVLIARALAQEPRILVMDEPTASLDFGNQLRVLGRVAALAASGMAVVLSTHDPDHVFLCGDRVALLHGGGMAAIGAPEAVITPAALKRLYGVDVQVVELPGQQTRTCVPAVEGLRRPRPAAP